VLDSVIKKKPELQVDKLGQPHDLNGRALELCAVPELCLTLLASHIFLILSRTMTLGELGVTEIAWGTDKRKWAIAVNHNAVGSFLEMEVCLLVVRPLANYLIS